MMTLKRIHGGHIYAIQVRQPFRDILLLFDELAQRDLTAEQAAERLRALPEIHYKQS